MGRYRDDYGTRADDDTGGCRPLIMMVISVSMTISAIVLLTQASDDLRKTELATYAKYTDSWKQINRSQFAHSNFVLWSPEGSVELQPDEDILHSRVRDPGTDVPKFEPYEYTLPRSSSPALIAPSKFHLPASSSNLYINATYNSEKGPITSTLGPIIVPLTTERAIHVSTPAPENRCRNQHGVYKGGQSCKVFARLRSMCVQVRLHPAHGWQLNPRPYVSSTVSKSVVQRMHQNYYGCDPVRHWDPASYSKVRAEYHSKTQTDAKGKPRLRSFRSWGAPDAPQLFDDFMFEVRSASDPYLEAKELTRNSTDFPISSHDATVLASILLVLALMLAIQPILEIRECCVDARENRKKYAYHDTAEWDDADTQLNESWSSIGPSSAANIRSRRNSPPNTDFDATTVAAASPPQHGPPATVAGTGSEEVGFGDLEDALHQPAAVLQGSSPVEVAMPASSEVVSNENLRTRSGR